MSKYDSRKQLVLDYVNKYYDDFNCTPSVRDIAAGTGIPSATVQRYLVALKDAEVLEYNGRRSVKTERMAKEANINALPVIGYVACGPGEEEQEEVIEEQPVEEAAEATEEVVEEQPAEETEEAAEEEKAEGEEEPAEESEEEKAAEEEKEHCAAAYRRGAGISKSSLLRKNAGGGHDLDLGA